MRRLLGAAFGAIGALRVEAYRRGLLPRHRLSGPVVSVGNLGVGGSGKTPVVRRVAELLRDAGEPVAVLSRGYGGRFAGDVARRERRDERPGFGRRRPATSR